MAIVTNQNNLAGEKAVNIARPSRIYPYLRVGRWLIAILFIAGIALGSVSIFSGEASWFAGRGTRKVDLSKVVLTQPVKGPLEISVSGTGSLDSVKSETLNCDVRVGEVKITYLIAEGTQVKKGDIVCEFDNSLVTKNLTEMKQALTEAEAKFVEAQERQGMSQNQTKTDIAKAVLDVKLAELDLVKYVDGEYVQNFKKLTSEILLKEEDLAKAREGLAFTDRMVKKGYMDQTDLESAYSTMKKSQVELEAKREELRVMVNYDKPRKIAEFEHKAEENKRELERVKSKSNIALKKTQGEYESRKLGLEAAKQNVKFWEEQLEKCKVKAPAPGEVVYANDRARNWGDDRFAIRVGNSVFQSSPVIRLPDMSLFQVNAKVHESLYSRLKLDLTCTVEVEAFPGKIIAGKVTKIGSVPNDDSFWNPGKKYDVTIALDKVDDAEIRLRPSLSCKYTILSQRLLDVLQLPVQSVVTIGGHSYIWTLDENKPQRRNVVLGESNDIHIEIKDGISYGENVVLNPRSTFAEEISQLESAEEKKSTTRNDSKESEQRKPDVR